MRPLLKQCMDAQVEIHTRRGPYPMRKMDCMHILHTEHTVRDAISFHKAHHIASVSDIIHFSIHVKHYEMVSCIPSGTGLNRCEAAWASLQ